MTNYVDACIHRYMRALLAMHTPIKTHNIHVNDTIKTRNIYTKQ